MFRVFRAEPYTKKLDKADNKEKRIMMRFEQKIAEFPYMGKTLGLPFLREKKFNGKRALSLVDEHHKGILFMDLTDKDEQQADIDHIIKNLDWYKEHLRRSLIGI